MKTDDFKKQMDEAKLKVTFNCRHHPTDWWHEVGCPHMKWTAEQLQSALIDAKASAIIREQSRNEEVEKLDEKLRIEIESADKRYHENMTLKKENEKLKAENGSYGKCISQGLKEKLEMRNKIERLYSIIERAKMLKRWGIEKDGLIFQYVAIKDLEELLAEAKGDNDGLYNHL